MPAYFYHMIFEDLKHPGCIPKRIVCLVPSLTELLYYLELNTETIGITKFCIHPADWFNTKARVGGTKTINFKKVQELQPDLIIANKEENNRDQIEQLAKSFPVWVTDVNNLEDAFKMIEDIGHLTGRTNAAADLIKQLKTNFCSIKICNPSIPTAYLIWQKPYMTVGSDTFINDMLLRCGFHNVFADHLRYSVITLEDLRSRNCRLLLLSSEPYPFKQKHVDELASHLPGTKIMLADGELFSWYGSRLLKSATYFNQLITQIQS